MEAENGERCSVIRGDGERDFGSCAAFLEYSWPWRPAPGCRRFIAPLWVVYFLLWDIWVAPSRGGSLFLFRVLVAPSLRGDLFEVLQGKAEGRVGWWSR